MDTVHVPISAHDAGLPVLTVAPPETVLRPFRGDHRAAANAGRIAARRAPGHRESTTARGSAAAATDLPAASAIATVGTTATGAAGTVVADTDAGAARTSHPPRPRPTARSKAARPQHPPPAPRRAMRSSGRGSGAAPVVARRARPGSPRPAHSHRDPRDSSTPGACDVSRSGGPDVPRQPPVLGREEHPEALHRGPLLPPVE